MGYDVIIVGVLVFVYTSIFVEGITSIATIMLAILVDIRRDGYGRRGQRNRGKEMINRLPKSSIEQCRISLGTNHRRLRCCFCIPIILSILLAIHILLHTTLLPLFQSNPPPLGQMKAMHRIQKKQGPHALIQIRRGASKLLEDCKFVEYFVGGEGLDGGGEGEMA